MCVTLILVTSTAVNNSKKLQDHLFLHKTTRLFETWVFRSSGIRCYVTEWVIRCFKGQYFLENTENHLPKDITSHPRRPESAQQHCTTLKSHVTEMCHWHMTRPIVLVMPNCSPLKFFSDKWMLRYCEVQDERQIHHIFSEIGILGLMGHNCTSFSCPGGSSSCRPVTHSTAGSEESSPDEVNTNS